MKDLVFIDNALQEEAEKDLVYARGTLKSNDIPCDDMEVIANFSYMFDIRDPDETDKIIDFFTEPNRAIVTWSVYSQASYYQLKSFLKSISKYAKPNTCTYIDTTGNLLDSLNKFKYSHSPDKFLILDALRVMENQMILTLDEDTFDRHLHRVRANLVGEYYDSDYKMFVLEEVDINQVLEI